MPRIKVTLLSDLCTASGDGFAGVVDTEITFDDYGLPVILAKRVKGCLKESAAEIVDAGGACEADLKELFGEAGQESPCGFTLENGVLEKYSDYILEIKKNHLNPADVLNTFTCVRTRTAMEYGQAKENSLRSARVVNQGNVFLFDVGFPNQYETFLKNICKNLRHMGLNRTRGLGEVKCELMESAKAETPAPPVTFPDAVEFGDGRKEISYTLTLEEPVIAAERYGQRAGCEPYFNGGTILGVFAVKWIKNHGNEEKPHENEEFRRLFLTGETTFSAAFPVENSDVYYPTPQTFCTDKSKDKLADERIEDIGVYMNDENPICKKLGGFVNIQGNVVDEYEVLTEVTMHHSRPDDRSIGHATATKGGEVFVYRALSPKQVFAGSIIAKDEDLEILKSLASDEVRIGRSRTAQYGDARLSGTKAVLKNDQVEVQSGETFSVMIRTPLVLYNDKGVIVPDLKVIPGFLGHEGALAVEKAYCTETVAAGYNAKWLLPRPQWRAVAEGSVILLKNISDQALTLPSDSFIGLRTNEGYGQIFIEKMPTEKFSLKEKEEISANETEVIFSGAGVLTEKIKKRYQKIEFDAKGMEDGKNFAKNHKIHNTLITRISLSLNKSSSFESFAACLIDIKKTKQRLAALTLCAEVTKDELDSDYVIILDDKKEKIKEGLTRQLEKRSKKETGAAAFDGYKLWLSACLLQLKYENRNLSEVKSDDE